MGAFSLGGRVRVWEIIGIGTFRPSGLGACRLLVSSLLWAVPTRSGRFVALVCCYVGCVRLFGFCLFCWLCVWFVCFVFVVLVNVYLFLVCWSSFDGEVFPPGFVPERSLDAGLIYIGFIAGL